jgi:hypothetical protein
VLEICKVVMHCALLGSHEVPAEQLHGDVAPAALLSVNRIAGDAPLMGQQVGGTKVRLFVSAVSPPAHMGALVVPLSTLVWTTIVEPGLGKKVANFVFKSPTH